MKPSEVMGRLRDLARLARAPAPVVTVYLNVHWGDEHQRERVRVFLKNELVRARAAGPGAPLPADLDWIETQGELLVSQEQFVDARGMALFACQPLDLREALPLAVPVDNAFVVADSPAVALLAEAIDRTPAALVVFVDGERARLLALGPGGPGSELALESDVPNRHRQGGWRLLAQNRYQRHIEDHRSRHFDAVAGSLTALVDEEEVEHIVLAGEPRTVAVFGKHLDSRVAERVAGTVAGTRHEPAAALVERATSLLDEARETAAAAAIEAALTTAAKGGRATAGAEATLAAAGRGAVQRLYLHRSFREPGRRCTACGALRRGADGRCDLCGGPTGAVDLRETLVDRVLASGGGLQVVDAHPALERVGGVAALLRYPG